MVYAKKLTNIGCEWLDKAPLCILMLNKTVPRSRFIPTNVFLHLSMDGISGVYCSMGQEGPRLLFLFMWFIWASGRFMLWEMYPPPTFLLPHVSSVKLADYGADSWPWSFASTTSTCRISGTLYRSRSTIHCQQNLYKRILRCWNSDGYSCVWPAVYWKLSCFYQ